MISAEEFAVRTRLATEVVETWVSAGWLLPQRNPSVSFCEADIARAALIRELKDEFEVNDEGVSIILHLLDQIHGLRSSLRIVLEEAHRGRSAGQS